MQNIDLDQRIRESKSDLKALEYKLVGKHLEAYKKKLDQMSDSKIHQIVLNRIVDALRDKKRLTKTKLRQQVISSISKRYWEKNEKDWDYLFQ